MKSLLKTDNPFVRPYSADLSPHPDAKDRVLEGQLLHSFDAAMRTGQAASHTQETILARRKGRPVGAVATQTKEALKLRVDADILAAMRATGKGWQTRVNLWLREGVSSGKLAA
jgi:uncharacterized protein (DUF4415 family)